MGNYKTKEIDNQNPIPKENLFNENFNEKKIEGNEIFIKRKLILGKLFEDIEKNNPESSASNLENLPKVILCKIIKNLGLNDVAKFFILNKHFFKFLWISNNSGE